MCSITEGLFAVLTLTLSYVSCGISISSLPPPFTSSINYPRNDVDVMHMLPLDFVYSLQNNMTKKIIETYCPAVRGCYSDSENKNLSGQTGDSGCCVPCDCSEDCFAKGNCCHDKEIERQEREDFGTYTSDGMTCVPVYVDPWGEPDTFFLHHVMLQQKCLNESEDTEYSENAMRCHFPSEEYIDDVTPVTSATSLVSYRNKFCAACNNDIESILSWQLKIRCSTNNEIPYNLFSRDAGRQEVYQALRTKADCSREWIPNTEAEITLSGCIFATRLLSKCPFGTPNILESLCAGSDGPFLPYFGRKALYRNMFCVACNALWMNEEFGDPDNESCIAIRGIAQPTSSAFTTLLTISSLPEDNPKDAGRIVRDRCEDGFAYNEILASCIKIVCPLAELLSLKRCIPMFDIVADVSFQYRVDFVFETTDQVVPEYDALLKDAVELVLKPHESEYFICESLIVGTRLEDGNMVIEAIVSKYIDETTSMRESFNEIKMNIAYMNEHNRAEDILYTVQLGESPFKTMFTNESRFLSYDYHGYYCTNSIAISERQFCRLVDVQNYQIGNREITVNGTIFYDFEFFYAIDETSHTSAYVCEALYVKRMTEKDNIFANCGVPFYITTGVLSSKYIELSMVIMALTLRETLQPLA